jgi:hypothetical protein
MRVILHPEDYELWLDPDFDEKEPLTTLLKPYPAEPLEAEVAAWQQRRDEFVFKSLNEMRSVALIAPRRTSKERDKHPSLAGWPTSGGTWRQ